jgi:hypothetical protein
VIILVEPPRVQAQSRKVWTGYVFHAKTQSRKDWTDYVFHAEPPRVQAQRRRVWMWDFISSKGTEGTSAEARSLDGLCISRRGTEGAKFRRDM